MSLLKLPLILTALVGTHVILTPPNPPPASNEQVKLTWKERAIPPLAAMVKPVFWAPPLFEMAVILANAFPSHAASKRVFHLLVHDLNPSISASKIQITSWFLIGWCITIVGIVIRYSCYVSLGAFFTFELGVRKDQKLITSGPYSVVRHPSYTGALLVIVGAVASYLNRGSWLIECTGLISDVGGMWALALVSVFEIVILVPRIGKEDRMLKARFGKEWEEWAANVPYRLLPGVY